MKLSIRFKILLGYAAIVLASFSIQTFGFFITDQFIRHQTNDLLLDKAQSAGDQLQNFITKVELDHLGISQEYIRNIGNMTQVLPVVEYALRQNRLITKINILSPTGRILIRGDKFSTTLSQDANFEIPSEPFKKALQGESGISKIYSVQEGGVPHSYVDFYTPITSPQGGVIGIVNSQLRMDMMWDLLAQISIGQKGFTYVVDDEGRLVAHPNAKLVSEGPNLSNRAIIADLINHTKKNNQFYTYINENNTLVVTNGIQISGLNWIVIAEQPQAEAYAELTTIRGLFFATIIGSLLLLILISVVLSDNITRPIRHLTHATEQIQKGNLDIRVSIKSKDEIELLGTSLNEMTDKLKRYVSELKEKIDLLEKQKHRLNTTASLLLGRDIDLRKIHDELEKETESISAERNKLSVILSGIKDAVIAVDLRRNIVLFNHACESLLDYSEEEAVNKPLQDIIKLYDKEDEIKPEIYCPIGTDTYEGVVYHENTVRLKGKNGKEAYVNIVAGKIRDSVANNLGCIITFHDLTSEQNLEKMKLDFVSMAAHELRTPLTSIDGYLSLFIDKKAEIIGDDGNMFLNRIQTSTHQLIGIVENLLSVTRMERGAFTISTTPLDWVLLAGEIIQSFSYRAKEKNIALTYKKPDTVIPLLNIDKIRITEVLSNLIDNAIVYTPNNGSVTISIEDNGNEVITRVKDTGKGIPSTALPNLFTKFFRVSGFLSKESKGTGLGLYISKKIVEMHKGKIWVESEVNKGSVFSFSVPK